MKRIGIFLDHSAARFINPDEGKIEREITCVLNGHERLPGQSTAGTKTGRISSSNNEYNEHNRRQEALNKYFKDISATLRDYQSVYLFGPTTAREQFLHYLQRQGNHRGMQLNSEKSDYLSDNQLVAKVKKYFD